MDKRLNNVLFKENEKRMNSLIVRIMWILTPFRLIPAIGKIAGVIPGTDYIATAVNTAMLLIFQTAISFFIKKKPNSSATKYVIMLIFQFVVVTLSMQRGVEVSLLYLIVPTLTLLYYDRAFSVRITAISYAVMLATLLYRAITHDTSYYSNMPRIVWIRAYAVGMTIEYTICTVIILSIANSIQSTMRLLDKKEMEAQKAKLEERAKSLNTQFDQQKIITGFANLVESRDSLTGEHIKRTRAYVNLISQRMKDMGFYADELTSDVQEYITQAAPLHDIGKICVPDHILTKEGPLTAAEREKMKEHSIKGEQIIRENLSYLPPQYVDIACKMARNHHERWDGRGYPDGLKGEEIPLCARIMAAADVLDALLSRRSYKLPIYLEDSLRIMKEGAGSQFDPLCIRALLDCADEIPALQIQNAAFHPASAPESSANESDEKIGELENLDDMDDIAELESADEI